MSNLLRNVALVPDDNIRGKIKPAVMSQVAAALQKQASRDFAPIWDIKATVDSFGSLDDVPLGYWPILVGKEGQGGGGVHLDDNNQPYALVDFTPDWTITASHECLEMLADPFGNRLVAGDGPDPNRPGRVDFLVEVCDPCEAPTFGYTVNGIRVSDFYTPQYFDPSQPTEILGAARYDFRGHIKSPRQVLRGGYLSWREPDGRWYQEKFFGVKPEFPPSIGKFDKSFGSLRAWIDSTSLQNREELMKKAAKFPNQVLLKMPGLEDNDLIAKATKERATLLRAQIKAVRAAAKASKTDSASKTDTGSKTDKRRKK